MLRHRASVQRDARAFTYLVDGETDEKHLTYGELDRDARAIAAFLEEVTKPGDRALLLYPPGLDFIAAFFGCLYAGVVAVTAYPPRKNRTLKRIEGIAEDADAHVALTTAAVLERVGPMLDQTPALKACRWMSTDLLPEGMEDNWRERDVDSKTLAFLQYTSGSTGTPKGVMVTHGNLLHNSELIAWAFEHTRSTSGVFWLPSYHDMGLVGGILQPIYVGRPNVLMSPMAFLQKPVRWLETISRYGGTTSGGPNFAFDLCVRKITPEQRELLDLSSWQVAFNGAEPVRSETLDRFAETFAPCGFRREAFYPCYGMAETTLIVAGGYKNAQPVVRSFSAKALENDRVAPCTASGDGERALVGCGDALPDLTVEIVDPQTGTRAAIGEVGEIWISGPSVAQGYWRRDEVTREVFGAHLADTGEGPYLRSGDLGFRHEGELFVTGRLKDLIIVRGVNHYPQDIELTVEKSHAALRDGAGAAFSVETLGHERVVVVQEIDRTRHHEAEAIIDAIRARVSAEHELHLDAIVLILQGSIFKTSSGKIQRHACSGAFVEGSLREIARWEADSATAAFAPTVRSSTHAPSTPNDETAERPLAPRTNGRKAVSNEASQRQSAATSSKTNHNGSEMKQTPSEITESVEEITQAVLAMARQMVPQITGHVTPKTSLAELGLDSLQRIELQSEIEEHFGGRIPPDVAPDLDTIEEVVAAVRAYLGRRPSQPAPADIPPENYRFEHYPDYVALREKLDLLEHYGIRNPFFTPQEEASRDTVLIGGQRFISFASFNYIGMSGDAVVAQAAKDAIDRYGTSSSASRLVSGEKVLHGQLERAISDLLGTEATIAFVGGHSTNESTIGHLFGPGDLILHDALAHNSIVQGAKLSGAAMRPFPHNDWHTLDRVLNDVRGDYRRVLIAIEGVYSMDGDIADVPGFVHVKKRHKAFLLVDEAHSIGVLGRHGRGVAEHFDLHPADVDLWMGTLSKSFGSCGGYIAGQKELVEYLKYTAPGFVFACGMSPANAGAALAAVRLLEAEPERVATLEARSALFLRLAKQHGINTGMSHGTPIIPVILGNSLHSLQLSDRMSQRGINVQPILYPAVEESKARLRFFITSMHSEEQIRTTVEILAEELREIDPVYLTTPAGSHVHPASAKATRHGRSDGARATLPS